MIVIKEEIIEILKESINNFLKLNTTLRNHINFKINFENKNFNKEEFENVIEYLIKNYQYLGFKIMKTDVENKIEVYLSQELD